MADENYRRLTCRSCAIEFTFESRAGRPPVECADCKRSSKQPKSAKFTHCQHCKSEIETPRHGKRFCSKACLYRERDGTKLTREQYREQCKERRKYSFTCACCGVDAYRKLSGTASAKGYDNKYCSMQCRVQAACKLRAEVDFLRGLSRPIKVSSKLPAVRSLARVLSRFARFREKESRPCVVCSKPVGYAFGRSRRYCSTDCIKQTSHYIAAKKTAKAKRKALKRGANGGESIDPIAVFIAAGWKCQLCNKPTPQRLRGTNHKRAPELDHVRPLSKGGTHTWNNVQCLCRECNGWKSDRVVVGQAGLFTALM